MGNHRGQARRRRLARGTLGEGVAIGFAGFRFLAHPLEQHRPHQQRRQIEGVERQRSRDSRQRPIEIAHAAAHGGQLQPRVEPRRRLAHRRLEQPARVAEPAGLGGGVGLRFGLG